VPVAGIMIHKNRIWINGENLEPPEEQITLGIDATGHAARIPARLYEMFG